MVCIGIWDELRCGVARFTLARLAVLLFVFPPCFLHEQGVVEVTIFL